MNRLQRIIARIAGLPVPSRAQTINAETLAQLRQPGDPHVDMAAVRRAIEAAMPPGVGVAEVIPMRAGMKPPADPAGDNMTWAMWQRCMAEIALDGWAPCRLGNRMGIEAMGFVFGVARGEYGIWRQPFPVCDDVAEMEMEPMILASLTFIPHGLGVGVFESAQCAAKAAELAGPILHGLPPDDEHAWSTLKDLLYETWRFHGIREDEHRHAHTAGYALSLPIWSETPANMLEGRPEKVS